MMDTVSVRSLTDRILAKPPRFALQRLNHVLSRIKHFDIQSSAHSEPLTSFANWQTFVKEFSSGHAHLRVLRSSHFPTTRTAMNVKLLGRDRQSHEQQIKNIKIRASEAQTTANIEEQSTTGAPPTK